MAMYGNKAGGQQWQPSVVYLLALVIVEIVAMAALRTFTKHGG